MEEMIHVREALVWNLKGRDHLEELGVDAGMVLECTLQKQVKMLRIGFIFLRPGNNVGIFWKRK
jgi:hypothetical protein